MSDATVAVETGEVEDATETQSTEEAKTFTQDEVDKIIAERLKREKSKYEKEAVAAAEKARIANLTESEKAIELARQEARAEVRRETASQLAQGRLKVVLTGLVEDPDAVIEDLDLSRFVTDEFEVDEESVKRIQDKYTKLLGNRKPQRTAAQPGRTSTVKNGGTAREEFAEFFQANF